MSRHVVARNPSPKVIVDEESTAVASEWEENSTAVEAQDQRSRLREFADAVAAQNRVQPANPASNPQDFAEKSGNSTMDELTVDEPRRQQNLNSVEITGEALANARLTVHSGSDKGREIDLRAGLAVTIGRGIDNTLVLTDIAASRKHFDLRYDGEHWCVKDRGSGNGTLINNVIQDHEVRLYNGDRIEIGNTIFLFDHPTCPERPKLDPWSDDDESTIGRTANEISGGRQLPPPPMELSAAPYSLSSAPKQQPRVLQPLAGLAPTPVAAARPATRPPPMRSRPSKPPPGPVEIVPLKPLHFANPPNPPLGRDPSLTLGQPSATKVVPAGGLPSTMPGAAPAMRPSHDSHPMPHGYAQPQPAQPAQPQYAQQPQHYPPAYTPTSGSQPSYNPPIQQFAAQAPLHASQPPAADAYGGRRTNRTFPPAITESRSSERMRAQQSSGPMFAHPGQRGDPTALVSRQQVAAGTAAGTGLSKRNKRIVAGVALGLLTAVVTAAALGGGAGKTSTAKPTVARTATVATSKSAGSAIGSGNNRMITAPLGSASARIEVRAILPDARGPVAVDARHQDVREPDDTAEKARIAAAEKYQRELDEKNRIATDKEKKERDRKEKERLAKLNKPDRPAKPDKPEPKPDPKPAVSDSDSKQKVSDLYSAKKFKEAAAVAKTSGIREVSALTNSYAGMARSYAAGMASATPPAKAFPALLSAISYDNRLGGDYISELNRRLSEVAPKAVNFHLGAQNWSEAAAIVRKAPGLGLGDNGAIRAAKSKLELEAGRLYASAQSASLDDAKQRYKMILTMVDESNKWFGKAKAALEQ